MKQNTRITLIAILTILVLLVIGGTIYAYVQKYAYAESDTNTYVNFNQLAQYTPTTLSLSGLSISVSNYSFTIPNGTSSTSNGADTLAQINLIGNHKYYIVGAFFQIYENGSFKNNLNAPNDVSTWETAQIYTAPNSNYSLYCQCFIYKNTTFVEHEYFIKIIDLTQMFGSNEPDLDTCNNYFKSQYYNYTTGTPINLNNLTYYSQGVYDSLQAQNVQYNNNIITNYSIAKLTKNIYPVTFFRFF